ncbi:hypothetical protein CJ030_MR2G028787 [Morella rubra]|uniref:Uncharacterized protein n=1 Tax=Morella rubra TaxID=262757 RepID=A0A6A1W9Z8_9ROSI|nr:hypothetical protein CJ030_MR2G028787 [Morella rubra]
MARSRWFGGFLVATLSTVELSNFRRSSLHPSGVVATARDDPRTPTRAHGSPNNHRFEATSSRHEHVGSHQK